MTMEARMENEMKFKYALVHGFPTGSVVDSYVQEIVRDLKREGITGEPPKIGTHATVFPNIWLTEKKAKEWAALLELAITSLGGATSVVTITGTGFFPPAQGKTTEAFHLKLEFDTTYHNLISRLKASDLFDWVDKPAQTMPVDPIFIPHVHIIEAVGLKNRIAPYRERYDTMVSQKRDRLYSLGLFRKKQSPGRVTVWERVVV